MQRTIRLYESDKPHPVGTQVMIPGESIWEHIQRTGHKQFFQEHIRVTAILLAPRVTSCAICSDQVYQSYPIRE